MKVISTRNTVMIILFFTLLNIENLFGQKFELYDQTNYFELTIPVLVTEKGNSQFNEYVPSGSRFTKLGKTVEGNIIVQFWKWGNEKSINDKFYFKSPDLKDSSKNIVDNQENRKIFIIDADDFKNFTIPYYKKGAMDWSAGLVVLPVKIRNNKPNFTYSKDLSLGFSGGGKIRISKYNPTYLNCLLNVGISSISADSLSSKGKIRQPTDLAALTTAMGFVFENHSFQFGFFLGYDRLSANDYYRTNWVYNRKPWISIGLGLQILSKTDKGQKIVEGKNTSK